MWIQPNPFASVEQKEMYLFAYRSTKYPPICWCFSTENVNEDNPINVKYRILSFSLAGFGRGFEWQRHTETFINYTSNEMRKRRGRKEMVAIPFQIISRMKMYDDSDYNDEYRIIIGTRN